METFGKGKVLSLANQVAENLEYTGPKTFHTIWTEKVAPGFSALYDVTSQQRLLDMPTCHTSCSCGPDSWRLLVKK